MIGMSGAFNRRGCKVTIDASEWSTASISVMRSDNDKVGESVDYELVNPDAMFGYDYEDSEEIQKIIDSLLDKYGDPEGPIMRIRNDRIDQRKTTSNTKKKHRQMMETPSSGRNLDIYESALMSLDKKMKDGKGKKNKKKNKKNKKKSKGYDCSLW